MREKKKNRGGIRTHTHTHSLSLFLFPLSLSFLTHTHTHHTVSAPASVPDTHGKSVGSAQLDFSLEAEEVMCGCVCGCMCLSERETREREREREREPRKRPSTQAKETYYLGKRDLLKTVSKERESPREREYAHSVISLWKRRK